MRRLIFIMISIVLISLTVACSKPTIDPSGDGAKPTPSASPTSDINVGGMEPSAPPKRHLRLRYSVLNNCSQPQSSKVLLANRLRLRLILWKYRIPAVHPATMSMISRLKGSMCRIHSAPLSI